MNAIRIFDIFKRIYFTPLNKPLGRWSNNHNYKQTLLKIKYATEDNCGISGNYKNTRQIQKNEFDDNEYIYIMGYESTQSN
jgi:hypothetical protein